MPFHDQNSDRKMGLGVHDLLICSTPLQLEEGVVGNIIRKNILHIPASIVSRTRQRRSPLSNTKSSRQILSNILGLLLQYLQCRPDTQTPALNPNPRNVEQTQQPNPNYLNYLPSRSDRRQMRKQFSPALSWSHRGAEDCFEDQALLSGLVAIPFSTSDEYF